MMNQLSLSNWADIADIISGLSIVGGLLFGLIQIRHYRAQQREAIATNLTQTFYSKDLAHALALLQELPNGIGLQAMRARGQHYVEAAITVTTSFETMGLLVYKRIAPLNLVVDLAGGVISVMADKLSQWQEDVRKEQNQPSWGEWFDWLNIQVKRESEESEPAHIRYRDWQP
jgi:hypothetical protein